MISDFVKGKTKFDYRPRVQDGIHLHRQIDSFTDSHEATREAKQVFRPSYRLYSGAFVDVIYDHFLATDKTEFTSESLFGFTESVYRVLEGSTPELPERFSQMLPYMKRDNWLYNYRTMLGTGKSLEGVVRRSAYLTESKTAFAIFEKHYQLLEACYRHFWASLKPFARNLFDGIEK